MITATEKQQMKWMQRIAALVAALAPKPLDDMGRMTDGSVLTHQGDGEYIDVRAKVYEISQEIDEWIANGGRKV